MGAWYSSDSLRFDFCVDDRSLFIEVNNEGEEKKVGKAFGSGNRNSSKNSGRKIASSSSPE